MIIFRYLAREILTSMLAVSSVLLLISMSGRFVKYLAQAASGKLAADVLLSIMAYRLPGFLELVLPLGLFIAILLAYGRLYMESEMVVLSACGMSQKRLLAYTMIPSAGVAAVVAGLSLYISPVSIERAENIFQQQRDRSEFESLSPARFQQTQGGKSVTYAESFSEGHARMHGVFMAQMAPEDTEKQHKLSVITAETGQQYTDDQTGHRYLLLKDGYRYIGRPGDADYQVTRFAEYAQKLEEPEGFGVRKQEADSRPTVQLWHSDKLEDKAALSWRFSIPVLVLVVVLMAVPLSKTNPRQGRYARMIPAVLLYIIYLVSLNAARGAVEDARIPVLGMWLVHVVFLMVALVLLSWGQWKYMLKFGKS